MIVDKEVNEKVANICKEFLGGQWLQSKTEDITIKPIIVGFANRTFHCILKNPSNANETEENEIPNEAVVKLYGNELVGKDSVIKIIGEAAEAVVLYKLSTLNLSPKLYGVFAGGRVEAYVEHVPSTPEFFRSLNVQSVVARKLANFHKLEMPVSKVPKYFHHLLSSFKSAKIEVDFNAVPDEDKKYVKALFSFPLKEEIQWILTAERKVKSRVVYSHNDFNLTNIVIRDKMQSLDEQIYAMDFETSCYYHRGFDIAYFMQSKHFRYVREKEETVKDYYEHSFTKEEMKNFLEAYLDEWKKNGNKFDEKLDTIENLEREAHFFGLQEYLLRLAFFMKSHNMPEIRVSMALSEYIQNMYIKRKEEYISKYGNPVEC